jgi:tripartite-type tricarboxylate transporter receptor subunit TctC
MKVSNTGSWATFAGALALTATAHAQTATDYPNRPVRVVVPQGPGGGTDIQARMFSTRISQLLGQQFVIDNRVGGGAAGVSAAALVARSSPDGYNLLAITPSFTFSPALYKDYPFDPIKDFTPVSLLTRAPYLLVVNASSTFKSAKDLIALARAQPGKLNFGAGNIGTGTHLVTEWFISAAGIKATYVPYKSTGPAMLDLIGGRLDGALTNVLSSGPHVKSGKLRALGISTIQRSKVLPDLATLAEQGVVGYNAATFHGYVAAPRTPAAIINKLSAAYTRVVRTPEMAEQLSEDGGEPVGSSPEEFRRQIAAETQLWRKLVQDVGIKIQN